MYYAEFCPYGIHTDSSDDTLMAFVTRKERDEMVERINAAHDECIEGCAVSVTAREATRKYNLHDFATDRASEHAHVRTCADRAFWEIGHKPSYVA